MTGTATLALAAAIALAAPRAAFAQSSYPMVMSLSPLAVQQGQTTECEVSARYNLYGAYRVFVTGEGVTAEVVPQIKPGDPLPEKKPDSPKIKVRFTATPDALLGVREFRVATPQGASTVGNLVVVRDPIVVEAASNNSLETAQQVSLPAALCGAVEQAEDVDVYKFHAVAGSAWTFHVRAARCEDQIHDLQTHVDPIISLKNAVGVVLAANDNYFFADPLLHHRFELEGDYFLEIRDVRYQGNGDWQYCIEATDRPFVTNVSPLRITPGVKTHVRLAGYNLPGDAAALVKLAADAPDACSFTPLTLGEVPIGPAPVVVSRLPEMIEADADNHSPPQAQPIAAPAGISGCIERAGDIDCFAIDVRQGERYTFEIIARRRQSALDPILMLLNDQGATVAESDDMSVGRHNHADSLIENWTAPSTGRFVLQLRDMHERGGAEYVYMLRVVRSEPYFSLELDTDKTQLSPGASAPIFVRVIRKNGMEGEVQLAIDGLPPGVTATCGRILPDGTDGAIVLTAAPDAKIDAANVRVTGKAKFKGADAQEREATVEAAPLQEIYMPGGGRYHYPVSTHVVAVSDPFDVASVTLSATEIRLKPGGSQRIDVTVVRKEGYKGNVTLDAVFQHLGSVYGSSLPKGVTLDEKNVQSLLAGDATQGFLTITAAADARPVERQLVPIMANVSINFVMKLTLCGEPLYVTVEAP